MTNDRALFFSSKYWGWTVCVTMVLDGLIYYNFTSHVHIGETIDNENFSGLRGHDMRYWQLIQVSSSISFFFLNY